MASRVMQYSTISMYGAMMENDTRSAQPPLSSKGGYDPANPSLAVLPSLAINLDWLRYTYPYNEELTQNQNLQTAIPAHNAYQLTGEMTANAKGYNSAMKLTIGVIHWHTERHGEGISVELPGSALTESRAARVEDMFLIKHIDAIGGRVSTMDAALDVYNADSSKDDIMYLHEAGCLETTAKNIGEYSNSRKRGSDWENEGTVYCGSPKSPMQIKIYNAYMKHGGEIKDWTRIEMRWRGRHARAAHIAMLRFGIEATTRKAIKRMLNADAQWFQYALTGELADIEPVRRKETNTVDWLIDFVLPILDRELANERAEGGTRLATAYSELLIRGGASKRRKRPLYEELTRVSKTDETAK